jgi:cystathionine gamma-synthase/methionine-gamma-lyase
VDDIGPNIHYPGVNMAIRRKAFSTRAVHAGEHLPADDFIPVVGPIHPTVGFVYEHMEDLDKVLGTTRDGYVYPRYGSPTVAAFETATADLEGGEAAYAFSSGMAAIHVALLTAGVRQGSSVLAAMDVYGATFTMLRRLFAELGVNTRLVDVTNLDAVEAALQEMRPLLLVAETISNPLLKVADQPALIALAHRYGAKVLIDNTFASPYLFNPCAHGADYVMHSATKFIAGHGDVLAGVIITSTENRKRMYELNKMIGSTLGPFEAWLALRGLKTLPLRMRQQCDSAIRIAQWLEAHPRIARINYPGLAAHPQHGLALRLFEGKGFGAVLSFEIVGADKAAAFRFMDALDLCLAATTLGDIYTIALHPASSSHRALSPEERAEIGISDGLVRLSIGIEEAGDIIADLEQALPAVGNP